MVTPVAFEDGSKVIYADTCTPLSLAAARGEVALDAWGRGTYPGQRLPGDSLHSVRSVGVWDATQPQGWGLDTHCNEGIEFTYLARGRLAFEVDDAAWDLHKGHLTITRPWQFHRVGRPHVMPSRLSWLILDVHVRRPNQPWRWPSWLLLTEADLAELTELLRQNEQPVWLADADVAGAFQKIAELLEEAEPGASVTRLKLYVNELLVTILQMLQAQQIALDNYLTTSHRAVDLFLSSLPRRLHEEWDLGRMATACGLSRSQFSTYCKQISNMTPIEYLRHCRLGAAARRLREEPELPITEVAFACGFNSSQYFATCFRARYGCSPSDFRHDAPGSHLYQDNGGSL